MKLAIYNNGIPFAGDTPSRGPLGGSESGIVYMARALAACGHDVTVYCNCPAPGMYDGVRYTHYHRFFDDHRAMPWDLVIAFRSFDPMLLGRIAPRMIYWTGDAADQNCLQGFAHPAIQENVDRVFCVSGWHRETFVRSFGLPPAKVVATRNGFSPYLPAGEHEKNIASAAYTSTPFRGLEILLSLFPHIRARVPEASLSVFSSMSVYGWSAEADRQAFGPIYDAANQPGVEWRGSVGQRDLWNHLARTGLLLYPNIFEETSCIAAIEAQAAGCVVVTSAKAGLLETVADGETGICISGDPRSAEYRRCFIDAAAGLMTNRDLWGRLSEKARARALRHYSWNTIASEWTGLFESIPPQPVTGRLSGPLSLLERAQLYLAAGNYDAARRVLARVSATPFFGQQVDNFKAALAEAAKRPTPPSESLSHGGV